MKQLVRLLVLVALVLMAQGCKTEYFDKQKVEEILDTSFHNDTVDTYHTWNLIKEGSIQVIADVADTKKVMLLSANPYVTDRAEILAEADAEQNDSIRLRYAIPVVQENIYVAAVTSSGERVVGEVSSTRLSTRISTLNTTSSGKWVDPSTQEIYYCYCNSYPQPSPSWDFNDLVLRLSRSIVDDYTLRINVTLTAVGTGMQEAAALRLVGVLYDEVESVTPVRDKRFVDNDALRRTIITEKEDLLRSLKGEAVINLFDDAHAAFYSRLDASGMISRYYYNATTTTDANHFSMTPKTISYDIRFKRSGRAKEFTFALMDPFIIYGYNGAIWEVHKYAYKFDEVLFEYYGGNPRNYDTGYTWALEIPYSWFGYPKEGTSMGSYKNGVLYGAYETNGHSFGQWAANSSQSRDWYLYPENALVIYK